MDNGSYSRSRKQDAESTCFSVLLLASPRTCATAGGTGAQEEINLAMSSGLHLEILSSEKHQLLRGQAASLMIFATPQTLSFLVERKVICCVAVALPDCVQVSDP